MTNALTDYGPIPGTNPTQYFQKTYAAKLLEQIAAANKTVLEKQFVTQSHPNITIPLQKQITLHRLAVLGFRDAETAWPVFQALWKELTAPKAQGDQAAPTRPKILLAMDNVGHALKPSSYVGPPPNMEPIHGLDLAFIHFFMTQLSSATKTPNLGLVLAATSGSDRTAMTPGIDFALQCGLANYVGSLAPEQRAALPAPESRGHAALPTTAPGWNPYVKIDARMLAALQDVPVRPVGGLSKDEARAVLDYYAASGVFAREVSEAVVGERWTLAGGGIVGELERGIASL
jgi:small subunit ribosomal protein S29